jgi:hypothetical protein
VTGSLSSHGDFACLPAWEGYQIGTKLEPRPESFRSLPMREAGTAEYWDAIYTSPPMRASWKPRRNDNGGGGMTPLKSKVSVASLSASEVRPSHASVR